MNNNFKKIFLRSGIIIATLSMIAFSGLLSIPAYAQDCPQERKTKTAPAKYLKMKNPLPPSADNIKAGEVLYIGKAKPIACKVCHGVKGDGNGDPDFASTPSARIFTCKKTMNALRDGQLFWVIKKGSKNTSMFSFSNLSDEKVWQLVHYIRQFAN